MDDPTFERIARFVATQSRVPVERLRPETTLEGDLGMTGDDAGDFMQAYAREFGVDMTDFEFFRHFGPEGCNPFFGLLMPRTRGHALRETPVTLALLATAARTGRWPSFRGPTA